MCDLSGPNLRPAYRNRPVRGSAKSVGGALWDSSHPIDLRSQAEAMLRMGRTRIARTLWVADLVALSKT
jgi:hypothetical protein